jgi:hypothetical protein
MRWLALGLEPELPSSVSLTQLYCARSRIATPIGQVGPALKPNAPVLAERVDAGGLRSGILISGLTQPRERKGHRGCAPFALSRAQRSITTGARQNAARLPDGSSTATWHSYVPGSSCPGETLSRIDTALYFSSHVSTPMA